MSNGNGNGTGPITLDMSKAQPIAPVTLDLSKARPIQSAAPVTSNLPETTQALGEQYLSPEAQAEANRKLAPASGALLGGILSGTLGPVGGVVTQMALQGGLGAAMGAGTAAQNENAKTEDLINSALVGGALGAGTALLGGVPGAFSPAKIGRGFINESMGAVSRDVAYGNPAKALLNEGIINPRTGDIEALKAGSGFIDAGGRLGSVEGAISELQPRVNSALSASKKTISMADAVDAPLMESFNEIANNRAMTAAEKQSAISQLGDLQKSLHSGLGNDISPLEANQLKNQIGARVRWTGTNAVGDEVRPAYKSVYASLKEWVNDAVPEVADTNERLTDLHAAKDALYNLAKHEEVGRGGGMLGGTIGTNLLGRLEKGVGRFLPAAAQAGRLAPVAAISSVPALGSRLNPDVRVTGSLKSLADLLQ